jgi:hypothetical protein
MYCSGCGAAVNPGQSFCPQCGRVAPLAVPPVPTMAFELGQFANRVSTLGTVWLLYAAVVLVTSLGGLLFAHSVMSGGFPWWGGPWGQSWQHGGMPFFFGPGFLRFVWFFAAIRVALLALAGWGLHEHAPWGRPVAIVAAFLSLIRIPLGTALGIWTLVMLMGYRNRSLYEQL